LVINEIQKRYQISPIMVKKENNPLYTWFFGTEYILSPRSDTMTYTETKWIKNTIDTIKEGTKKTLSGGYFGTAESEIIIDELCKNVTITSLTCNNDYNENLAIEQIARALEVQKTIHTLELMLKNLSSYGVERLSTAFIRRNNSLNELIITRSTINLDCCKHLSKLLQYNTNLTKLRLNNAGLNGDTFSILFKGLELCTAITHFSANNNLLENQGSIAIKKWLIIAPNLEDIELQNCKITSNDLLFITKGLMFSSVISVNLLKNELHEEKNYVYIGHLLTVNVHLQRFLFTEGHSTILKNSQEWKYFVKVFRPQFYNNRY